MRIISDEKVEDTCVNCFYHLKCVAVQILPLRGCTKILWNFVIVDVSCACNKVNNEAEINLIEDADVFFCEMENSPAQQSLVMCLKIPEEFLQIQISFLFFTKQQVKLF